MPARNTRSGYRAIRSSKPTIGSPIKKKINPIAKPRLANIQMIKYDRALRIFIPVLILTAHSPGITTLVYN